MKVSPSGGIKPAGMEQLVMNRKERERLVVFSRVKDKELSRLEAPGRCPGDS